MWRCTYNKVAGQGGTICALIMYNSTQQKRWYALHTLWYESHPMASSYLNYVIILRLGESMF